MTIEVGVVRGNFERVQTELADMLVQLRVKTDNQSELAELEQRIESINVRAETFLKSLGMDDDNGKELADLIKSTEEKPDSKSDQKTSQPTDVSDQEKPGLQNGAPDKDIDQLSGLKDSKTDKADLKNEKISAITEPLGQFNELNSAPDKNPPAIEQTNIKSVSNKVDGKEVGVRLESLELSSITNELTRLSDLVIGQGDLIQQLLDKNNGQTKTSKKSETTELNYKSLLDQYLTMASSNIIKADLEIGDKLIVAIHNSVPDELLVSLPEWMTMLKDHVMQPSFVVHCFLGRLLKANLNPEQQNVLNRLFEYQKTSLQNARLLNPLPSPWTRGMKDLFSDI